MRALVDAATLKQLRSTYDRMSRQQLDTCLEIDIHYPAAVGLKEDRVILAPGLCGVVSSDDGKQVTVFYYDLKQCFS